MSRKRSIIIIEVDDAAAANLAAAEVTGNLADSVTFTSPLSADGLPPATHYVCSVVLADDVRPAVLEAMAAAAPGALWWRLDGPDPIASALLATNVAASASQIGQAFTARDALAAVGLWPVVLD